MARVLFTAVVAEMRGKLNGNVFSRNKGGAVIRNKVTPINPRTSYQSQQRGYTSDISKAWASTLTDDQRNAWTAWGRIAGAKSVFGNGIILSGIAAFMQVNRIILASGGTRVDDAPINKDIATPENVVLVANHTGPVLTVAFDPSPYSAGSGLYVFATPAISPGISNATTQQRLIGYYDAATTPLAIDTEWIARFGAFPGAAGQRIAVTVAGVNTANGAISAGVTASTLVI